MKIASERAKDHRSLADILLCVASCTVIFVFALLLFLLPKKKYSETERRTLATFPHFSFESLIEGKYTKEISDFCSDRFPMRETMRNITAVSSLAALQFENGNVILGGEHQLIKRVTYSDYDYERLDGNLSEIKKFSDTLAKRDVPTSLFVAPKTSDIVKKSYPPYFYDTTKKAFDMALSLENAYNCNEELISAYDDGEYVMFRTDHHYTQMGAYYAYLSLADALNIEPLSEDKFEKVKLCDGFLGTTASSSGFPKGILGASADELYVYFGDDDSDYTVKNVITGEKMMGFYNLEYLDSFDKYSVFLGENSAHLRIYNEKHPERPTLLIIKDSFSHSSIPFLARHFNLEVLDLRYYNSPLSSFLEENPVDQVLFFYGIDSLVTGNELSKINYKLK